MAATKLEIELRCAQCDTVLIVASVYTDENGQYAYVEPCPKCTKEEKAE